MTDHVAETSPSNRGQILAALYLFVIIAGIFAQALISDRPVVGNDAARTAANLVANKSLYRFGFTIFMLEMATRVVASAMFYDLLKPVNRSVARLSLVLALTASGIKTFARLFFDARLILLGGASYLSAIPQPQHEDLSLALIKINGQAAGIAIILFGFET